MVEIFSVGTGDAKGVPLPVVKSTIWAPEAARAVAALNVLCEYCLPFVKVGGTFAALKGEKDETEEAENAIKKLGGEITEIKRYSLPGGDKRTLVIIKKVSPTPAQYPRVSAKIAKKPL